MALLSPEPPCSTMAPAPPLQMSAMQKELGQLTRIVKDMASNNNRPTVVHLGGKNGWSVLIYPAVIGGTVMFVYCKITGNSIFDLLYVSRSSLASFRNTVRS